MRTLSPPCSYTRWLTPPSFIFHNHQQLSSEENPPLMLASATIQLGQAGQGRGQAGAPAPEWVTQGPLSARVWRGQSGSHTDPSLLLPHNGIMITGQEWLICYSAASLESGHMHVFNETCMVHTHAHSFPCWQRYSHGSQRARVYLRSNGAFKDKD